MASKTYFRNLTVFRLKPNWNISAEQLAEQLDAFAFKPCGPQDAISAGFTQPRGDKYAPLAASVNGQYLIAAQEQKRILPSSVVKEVAQERASEIAEREGRKVGRRELKELREQVTQELMPKAFLKTSMTQAWINPKEGWLVVNTGSAAKADLVVGLLNKAIEDFPISRLTVATAPDAAMADWLASGEAPANFTVDRDCELRSAVEEKAAVRYVRHSLEGQEIRDHLANGKRPTRLALTYNDRISFVLTNTLVLKGVSMLDVIAESVEPTDNADELFESEFALMTGELTRLLDAVVESLGGEAKND